MIMSITRTMLLRLSLRHWHWRSHLLFWRRIAYAYHFNIKYQVLILLTARTRLSAIGIKEWNVQSTFSTLFEIFQTFIPTGNNGMCSYNHAERFFTTFHIAFKHLQ